MISAVLLFCAVLDHEQGIILHLLYMLSELVNIFGKNNHSKTISLLLWSQNSCLFELCDKILLYETAMAITV